MLTNLMLLGRRRNIDSTEEYAKEIARNLTQLINKAQESVIIVSGKLRSRTYASTELLHAIKKARDRGVAFKLLVGEKYDRKSKGILDILSDCLYESSTPPKIHFAIADNLHIRYEGIHLPETPVPENHLIFNVPESAALLNELVRRSIEDIERLRDGPSAYREQEERKGDA